MAAGSEKNATAGDSAAVAFRTHPCSTAAMRAPALMHSVEEIVPQRLAK